MERTTNFNCLKALVAIGVVLSCITPVSASFADLERFKMQPLSAVPPTESCIIDGNWSEVSKLMADDAAPNSFFGTSVYVDGDYAIVGAFFAQIKGAAYIFKRTGTAWAQEAKLTASDGQYGDQFGACVSISGDYALVSAQSHDTSKGAAYIFKRSGTSWAQEAELTADDGLSGDAFSTSVAIEGEYAVIGAPNHDEARGAVYIFKRTETTWTQETQFTGSDTMPGDAFGFSVSLNGTSILVGARYANAATGSAYVYSYSRGTWTEEAKLQASDGGLNDQFGISVSIDHDAAIIGAGGNMSNTGYAYVFSRVGTTWTQEAKIVGSNSQIADGLGWSVSISGSYAVAGGPGGEGLKGSAYVFHNTGSSWVEDGKLIASDAVPQDFLGIAVSIDGDTVVGGAFQKDSQTGAAYVFKLIARPELSIGAITGGFHIKTTINNTGDAPANNVTWTINITGGVFGRINSQSEGTMPFPIDNCTLTHTMFFGLGPIVITVTATCDEGSSAEKTVNGTQILVYTRIS